MTSQESHNKGISMISLMKEDLSHRKWMLVLSSVVQLLCGPVAALFLISWRKSRILSMVSWQDTGLTRPDLSRMMVSSIIDALIVLALVVVVCGALITGIGGFRHLFNRRMTDMINSVPVKRGRMFAVIYLNGFLIWFVPFIVSELISLVIIGANASGAAGYLLGKTALMALGAAFAFVCIYNLIVLSMAMSGTVMNALTNILFIGFDALAVYGMWVGLCANCFSNYSQPVFDISGILWTSAPASGCFFGYLIADNLMSYSPLYDQNWIFIVSLVLTMIIAAVNLYLAFRLYTVRKSEESEAGTDSDFIRRIIRILNSILAGLFVSAIIISFFENGDLGKHPGWGVFFAIFFSLLTFGFINAIQSKSIRRFFSHKAEALISAAAAAVIFLTFALDLTGFDNRIIPKESIKEAYVTMDIFAGNSSGADFMPAAGREGCLVPVYSDPYYDWNLRNKVKISPDLAFRIMTAEKYYWFNEYGSRGYKVVDPVSGEESVRYINGIDEISPRVFYLDITRGSSFHFRRQYLIVDPDIAEEVIMTEGFMEERFPVRCGALGYPKSVTVTDNRNGAEYIIPKEYVKLLMDAYYADFIENYSPDYLESGDDSADILLNPEYDIDYGDGNLTYRRFNIDVKNSDKRTIEILDRLSDSFMFAPVDEDFYTYFESDDDYWEY